MYMKIPEYIIHGFKNLIRLPALKIDCSQFESNREILFLMKDVLSSQTYRDGIDNGYGMCLSFALSVEKIYPCDNLTTDEEFKIFESKADLLYNSLTKNLNGGYIGNYLRVNYGIVLTKLEQVKIRHEYSDFILSEVTKQLKGLK